MRVVLDTNVLVSGLMFPAGVPGQIVAAWTEARFDIVSCDEQVAEIGRVLAYQKIRRILKWDDRRIEQFLKRLYVNVEVVALDPIAIDVPRDPDDATILTALVISGADILVSGDRDLLVLRDRYPIETPSEFSRRL